MGLLSWWKSNPAPPPQQPAAKTAGKADAPAAEIPGMNGAVEVRRPLDVTVFEFGSAKASGESMTLAGYCPVSEELEPCRWEIVPAAGSEAPLFRIVF